jgi:hypothetical protein
MTEMAGNFAMRVDEEQQTEDIIFLNTHVRKWKRNEPGPSNRVTMVNRGDSVHCYGSSNSVDWNPKEIDSGLNLDGAASGFTMPEADNRGDAVKRYSGADLAWVPNPKKKWG